MPTKPRLRAPVATRAKYRLAYSAFLCARGEAGTHPIFSPHLVDEDHAIVQS
ncbi:MAG: hypothetical protein ABI806_02780 [Candidatus Solibacter sp.]